MLNKFSNQSLKNQSLIVKVNNLKNEHIALYSFTLNLAGIFYICEEVVLSLVLRDLPDHLQQRNIDKK